MSVVIAMSTIRLYKAKLHALPITFGCVSFCDQRLHYPASNASFSLLRITYGPVPTKLNVLWEATETKQATEGESSTEASTERTHEHLWC